jgi:hypothetical protein
MRCLVIRSLLRGISPAELYVKATFVIPGKMRIPKEFWTQKTPESYQDHSITKSSGVIYSGR